MATITASSMGIDAAVSAYVPQPLPGPQPPVDRALGWAAPTATRPRLSATGSGQGLNGNITTKGKAAAYKIKHTNVLLKVDAKGLIVVGQDAEKETMNRANLFVRIRVIRSSSSFSLIGNAQLKGTLKNSRCLCRTRKPRYVRVRNSTIIKAFEKRD